MRERIIKGDDTSRSEQLGCLKLALFKRLFYLLGELFSLADGKSLR